MYNITQYVDLEMINAIYSMYFILAFIAFALMIIFNFKVLKTMSTARLILLYITLPILHFRAFLNWLVKKTSKQED